MAQVISVDMIGLWCPIEVKGTEDKFYQKITRCHNLDNSAAFAVLLDDDLYAADKKTKVMLKRVEPRCMIPNPPLHLLTYVEAKAIWDEAKAAQDQLKERA